MKIVRSPWTALFGRLAIGALFLLAGSVKLANPGSFAATLLAYGIFPVESLRVFALTLPWLEAGIGVSLLVGMFTRPAAYLAIAMLTVFMLAIAQALLRGLCLDDCGCFGDVTVTMPALSLLLGGADTGWNDVVRDAIYLGIAVLVIVGPDTPFRLETHLRSFLHRSETVDGY